MFRSRLLLVMGIVAVGCGASSSEVGEGSSDSGTAGTTSEAESDGSLPATSEATSVAEGDGTLGDTTDGGEDTTGLDGDSSGSDTGVVEEECTPFPPMRDFTDEGPFDVTQEDGGSECTIFRPTTLGEEDRLHPIILWGNGTATTPAIYASVLNHWASQGFIVAAANTSSAGTGEEMLGCLDWLTEQEADGGSVYAGVVDFDHVGASGHSQGGGGALMAGQDPRVTVTAPLQPYTQQGFGGYDQACQDNQAGPMFMMSGSADFVASPNPNQQRVFDDSNVPTLWGTLAGASHFVAIGNIRGYRGPATAWFRYHLMCDELARPVFYDECELCDQPDWDVQTKNW